MAFAINVLLLNSEIEHEVTRHYEILPLLLNLSASGSFQQRVWKVMVAITDWPRLP